MRTLVLLAFAGLALAACTTNDTVRGTAAPPSRTATDPSRDMGRTDSPTSGSTSNAASGSSATQQAAPRVVP